MSTNCEKMHWVTEDTILICNSLKINLDADPISDPFSKRKTVILAVCVEGNRVTIDLNEIDCLLGDHKKIIKEWLIKEFGVEIEQVKERNMDTNRMSIDQMNRLNIVEIEFKEWELKRIKEEARKAKASADMTELEVAIKRQENPSVTMSDDANFDAVAEKFLTWIEKYGMAEVVKRINTRKAFDHLQKWVDETKESKGE